MAMTDEGGPEVVPWPVHRSAPMGYHRVMLSEAKHPFSPSFCVMERAPSVRFADSSLQEGANGFFGLRPQNDGAYLGASGKPRPTAKELPG